MFQEKKFVDVMIFVVSYQFFFLHFKPFCIPRAQFDRIPHGKGELGFKKGDILHVTETLYNGQLGVWNASIVHENDSKTPNAKSMKGKIPSKRK